MEKPNKSKYESYKYAFNLLNNAINEKSLPLCIASIAIIESIISDRCYSYLYKNQINLVLKLEKENKFVNTSRLVSECSKFFKNYNVKINRRNGESIETNNLFYELLEWLKIRNKILHSFVKSVPMTPTQNIEDFINEAINSAMKGYNLIILLKKWDNKNKY